MTSTAGRIALVCAVVAMAVSVAGLFIGRHRLKVGYVRTTELVYGYSGTNEAHQVYERKRQNWQGMLDSLSAEYQKALAVYTSDRASLSTSARQEREKWLEQQHRNLEGQRADFEGRIRDEDQRMTQGVLNQINSMGQQYGRENGFDLILSTTQSGSILYGDDALDITKPLLEMLNRNYNPAATNAEPAHEDSVRRDSGR